MQPLKIQGKIGVLPSIARIYRFHRAPNDFVSSVRDPLIDALISQSLGREICGQVRSLRVIPVPAEMRTEFKKKLTASVMNI